MPRRTIATHSSVCAMVRSRAHGRVTRAMPCENLREKCRAHDRDAQFVRACAVERHMDMAQGPMYTRIYRESVVAHNRDAQFVRACAVELHIDMVQEWLYARIYRKNGGEQMEHHDQTPAFTLTVRTLQWGHAVWGRNSISMPDPCAT